MLLIFLQCSEIIFRAPPKPSAPRDDRCSLDSYRLVTYGMILVITTIFMPRGLVPFAKQLFVSAIDKVKGKL